MRAFVLRAEFGKYTDVFKGSQLHLRWIGRQPSGCFGREWDGISKTIHLVE